MERTGFVTPSVHVIPEPDYGEILKLLCRHLRQGNGESDRPPNRSAFENTENAHGDVPTVSVIQAWFLSRYRSGLAVLASVTQTSWGRTFEGEGSRFGARELAHVEAGQEKSSPVATDQA